MNCTKCCREIPADALYCPFCGKKQQPEKRKALKRPNGMGTVYKLQGRRKRPWVSSKARVVIGYYETKTEALASLERVSDATITDKYNMTFAEVYTAWSAQHYKKVGVKGKEQYERAYDVFKPLHDRKFRSLRKSDYQTVLEPHMSKSYSTVSKYKQLITQMSAWALDEDIITVNYASRVALPENQTAEKEIFSNEDIQKLVADDSETAKVVLMLICTGMRINELFQLPLEDYHGDYVIGGEKTEAGRNRVIPIISEGRKYFDYFAQRVKGPLLLSGYAGQHIAANFRRRDYYPLLERLGIRKMSPHSTRHTYTSWAVESDIKAAHLKKILGHKSITTTIDTYYHTTPEQLIKAVNDADVTNTLLTSKNKSPKKVRKNPENR